MKPAPWIALAALGLLAACATTPDRSHYVDLGSKHGYYIIEPGSPLQDKLGYGLAPVSDTASPLHRGYGKDVVAFRFNRAGVLAAPPAYLAQISAEPKITRRLGMLRQGYSTWTDVRTLFPVGNQRLPQPDGGLLVYHDVPIYNALEDLTNPGGDH